MSELQFTSEGDRSISYERENGSTITITKEDPESIMDAGE